jgi:hypothetical protein
MKIEAVTVSINYSDYLEKCIERNSALLDRWVIVTDRKDINTIELCRHYQNIELVFTRVEYQPGIFFPKSRMVNEGFERLYGKDWVVHIDSDILLPQNTRTVLDNTKLEREVMYGTEYRWMLNDKGEYVGTHGKEFKRNIGFFQLFHSKYLMPYPENSLDAGEDDMEFNFYWEEANRRKIKGLIPKHFGPKTTFWKGRILDILQSK